MFLLHFFDDYIFAGNRFQLVQGLESSFHALDLIFSQQAPRRTRGQQHVWRGRRRVGNAQGARKTLTRSSKSG